MDANNSKYNSKDDRGVLRMDLSSSEATGSGDMRRTFAFNKKCTDSSISPSFRTSFSGTDSNCLSVIQEPSSDATLREVSEEIEITEDLIVFMTEYLLPTCYKENGIGIAAIQVGLPIRAMIVDIPVVTSINGEPIEFAASDPRFVRKAVASGSSVRVRETRPVYSYTGGGQLRVHHTEEERIVMPPTSSSSRSSSRSAEQHQQDTLTSEVDIIVNMERRPIFIVNPILESVSEQCIVIEEGCLSVPYEFIMQTMGQNTKVERPLGCCFQYESFHHLASANSFPSHSSAADTHWTMTRRSIVAADGSAGEHQKWMSRCLQHEFDHLQGILFTDRLFVESNDDTIGSMAKESIRVKLAESTAGRSSSSSTEKQTLSAPTITSSSSSSSATIDKLLLQYASQGHTDKLKQLLLPLQVPSQTVAVTANIITTATTVDKSIKIAPNLHATDERQMTALHLACKNGHLACVEELLKCYEVGRECTTATAPVSGDVNARCNSGISPLVAAAVKGHADIVQRLLTVPDVDPNFVGFRGRGALFGACRHGHPQVVRILLSDERVDVNTADEEKRTPLYDAARTGRLDIVRILLECPRFSSNTESIPHAVDGAEQAGHTELAEYMKRLYAAL